jgi:nucleotide-binding universal stress UspA family protein
VFRAVLVHTDHNEFAADRVAAAVSVARRFNATLIGLTAGLPQLPYEVYSSALGSVGVGTDYTAADRNALKAEFAKTQASFEEATRASGLETGWMAEFESPSRALSRSAVGADIVVLGSGDNSLLGHEGMVSAGDVLLHTGRPVLLVPDGFTAVNVGVVMIAWKDGPEAQRAIADALPFLKDARTVVLVEIQEPGDTSSGARAAAFLVRHGIPASVEVRPREGDVAELLLQRVKALGADMIVAGGYGHTRLREWVFGGVTRALLTRSPVPCLLSH